jgi:heterotetrameric sarcosine oxidase delta subunit
MLQIECPWCGPRAQTEFSYGGDATLRVPAEADAPLEQCIEALYLRANPKGVHTELWHHSAGCRQWLRVLRDTTTHEVLASGHAHADLSGGGR